MFFDGKLLKQKLLPFPDLIVKYFADDTTVLVKNILKQWLFHDILPDVNGSDYLVWQNLKEIKGKKIAELYLKRENMQMTVEIAIGSMYEFKKEESRPTKRIKFTR